MINYLKRKETPSETKIYKEIIKNPETDEVLFILCIELKESLFLWLSNHIDANFNNLALSMKSIKDIIPISSLLLGEIVQDEYTIQLSKRLAKKYNKMFFVSTNLISKSDEISSFHSTELALKKYLDTIIVD
ncbi:hypothetical protein K502DRAFT_326538 [Neoconidiobolus thromboides FSU 785]|nr:hypothetical protein K502DRAFT_326538 [Neoconidiobolus thromboides FSU 785]